MSETNTDPNSPQMAGCQQEPCSRWASIHRNSTEPYYGGEKNGSPVWVAQPWRAVKVPGRMVDKILAKMPADMEGLHAIIYPPEAMAAQNEIIEALQELSDLCERAWDGMAIGKPIRNHAKRVLKKYSGNAIGHPAATTEAGTQQGTLSPSDAPTCSPSSKIP